MAENSKIEWTDRVCELEDELAAVRAELERALVVVQAAVAYAKADGPEAMMPLLSLEHAVSAWKAGRCVLAGDAADALRAALSEAEKRRKPCTCHDTSRGPGRPCAVKAGTKLGKLWQCVEEPRRELSDEVEAVIACLEDDAAWLREQMADNEIATNMDEAAKLLRTMQPRRELSERDGRQHTHEARRWCSGDSAWSEWQPCTAEQAASYAKDETFQVRAARGEG